MPVLIALAVSVGVLAVGATWLFFLPALAMANLQVWQGFIAWGCHYHCGGKVTGTRNTIICMSFGAVVGMAAVLLAGIVASSGTFDARTMTAAPMPTATGAASEPNGSCAASNAAAMPTTAPQLMQMIVLRVPVTLPPQ